MKFLGNTGFSRFLNPTLGGHKMIRSLILTLLVVFLAGCGLGNEEKRAGSPTNNLQQNVIGVTSPSKAGNNQANAPDTPVIGKPGSSSSTLIYPQQVQDLIETMRTIEGGSWVTIGEETFIVVSRGMKPTAGYSVEIKDFAVGGDRAVVYVSFIDPPEGSAVAEVITYPYAVKKVKGRFVDVEFRDVNGKIEYVPRVVGLKDNFLAKGEGNIRLISYHVSEKNVVVTGIARVFEANVNYELQDASGKVLCQGYTMTAAGAPNWGFFQLEINNCPPAASIMKIYQVSPEDGSHQDTVTINITLSKA